jgi:hypothetical protein
MESIFGHPIDSVTFILDDSATEKFTLSVPLPDYSNSNDIGHMSV